MSDGPANIAAPPGSPMAQLPLETARLLLRPYSRDDAPAIVRMLNDPEMARFLMVTPYPFVEFDAKTLVKAAWRRMTGGRGFDLLVETKAPDGKVVGSVGVGLHDEGARAELGFWIGRDHWGQGYATEAANRMMDFASGALKVPRFTGTVATDNAASLSVLAKLGFAETGRDERKVPSTGEMREVILLERKVENA
jgi:8-oxo-dGTP diphosphatase